MVVVGVVCNETLGESGNGWATVDGASSNQERDSIPSGMARVQGGVTPSCLSAVIGESQRSNRVIPPEPELDTTDEV